MAETPRTDGDGPLPPREILEILPLAHFTAGPDGAWTWGNARFRDLAGLSPGENLAEAITRRVDPGEREEVVRTWREATAAREPFVVEFSLALLAGPAGSARRLRARAVPVTGGDGSFRGYAGVLEDVTEDRRREALLLEEAAREKERSRRKSEFLAVMSHELRTPLHGVVGTAALLQSSPLSPEQREYADMLGQSADAALSVIDNVLDLSKIEAGRLELSTSEFDLREVVEKSTALFAARAHGKGLDLASRVAENLPPVVRGDPVRLRQVLVNLLGNAVKFTEKGEIVLAVTRLDAARGAPPILRFEVRDTGMGIPEEARARLFEAFGQADASIAARFGGTGLGLAICRQLVRLMNGVLGADSTPGKGSTFWFTAELPVPEGSPALEKPPEDASGRRILLGGDRPATRAAAGDLLRAWGCLVKEAPDAAAVLRELRRGLKEYEPVDAVLLCMDIPGEGGARGLVETACADPGLESVKWVVVTPFGHRARAEAARWQGVAAFLPRPIRRHDLASCLAAALSGEGGEPYGRRVRPRAPASSLTGSFRVARILVVDDNEVNRRIAARQLEHKGFLVETAVNGLEAVEKAKRTPYDIIFMDWVMPELDGFGATRRIRENEKASGIRVPIVAMTARAMEGDREKCLEPGMDDYVSKPVRIEDLDAILDRWLSPDGKAAADGVAKAGGTAPAVQPPRPPLPDVNPSAEPTLERAVLDSLAEISDGDKNLVDELTTMFTAEAGPRMERFRVAVSVRDAGSLQREAHGLKGSSASLGAKRLAAIAKRLEHTSEGVIPPDVDAQLREVQAEYDLVCAALRAYGVSRRLANR